MMLLYHLIDLNINITLLNISQIKHSPTYELNLVSTFPKRLI